MTRHDKPPMADRLPCPCEDEHTAVAQHHAIAQPAHEPGGHTGSRPLFLWLLAALVLIAGLALLAGLIEASLVFIGGKY